MRDRVAGMLGGGTRRSEAYTFHGFCLELLKGYGHLVGLPERLQRCSPRWTPRSSCDADSTNLDLSHLENLSDPGLYVPGRSGRHLHGRRTSCGAPDGLRAAGRGVREAAEGEEEREAAGKALEAAKVYTAYQDWLDEDGYVDYGDLVRLRDRRSGGPGGRRARSRGSYEHILVDEFQDINFASGSAAARPRRR